MTFLPPNQQRQSTEGNSDPHTRLKVAGTSRYGVPADAISVPADSASVPATVMCVPVAHRTETCWLWCDWCC